MNASREAARSEVDVAALSAPRSRLLRVVRTANARSDTRRRRRRYYRCAARARYPGIADAHPRDVLVPEQPVIDALDEWLSELFAPDRAADTAREIVAASEQGRDRSEQIEGARRRIAAARRELDRCRAAFATQARSPPGVRSCHGSTKPPPRRSRPSRALETAATSSHHPRLPLRKSLPSSNGAAVSPASSTKATDEERAGLYASMGVSAVYDPERNEVRLGVDPVALTVCRRGDLNPHAPKGTSPSS